MICLHGGKFQINFWEMGPVSWRIRKSGVDGRARMEVSDLVVASLAELRQVLMVVGNWRIDLVRWREVSNRFLENGTGTRKFCNRERLA